MIFGQAGRKDEREKGVVSSFEVRALFVGWRNEFQERVGSARNRVGVFP